MFLPFTFNARTRLTSVKLTQMYKQYWNNEQEEVPLNPFNILSLNVAYLQNYQTFKNIFFLFQTYWIVSDFSYDRNIFIIKFDLKKNRHFKSIQCLQKGLLRIYSLSAFEKGYDPLFVHTIPKMFLLSLGQNVEMILSLQTEVQRNRRMSDKILWML